MFTVEDGGEHSLIVDFLYNGTDIEDLTLTISDGVVERTGYFTLHYCDEVRTEEILTLLGTVKK